MSSLPLVLIPGVQGRWEWMLPAVRSLSARRQVLTFSLGDVRGEHIFDRWIAHIDQMLDRAGARSAILTGVSFGGLVAVRYAAQRPERVRALILVSAPSPRIRLDSRTSSYLDRPRLSVPLFALRSVSRLLPEFLVAPDTWRGRITSALGHLYRVVRFPISPPRMSQWVREWQQLDLVSDCRTIAAPTLLVTGEASLDRVVPVTSTLDYLSLIPGSRHVTLAKTGHIGLVMRPEAFAKIIEDFSCI